MSFAAAWQLRTRLDGSEPVLNVWMSLSDPFVAEVLGSQGWHAVTVDRQHGRTGPGDLWDLALAIVARGASPLIRVSQLDPAEIAQALDAGFEGVICPMVNSVEDAVRLVAATRYPPAGVRSYGPTRAALGQESEFLSQAGGGTIALAMIETAAAIDQLEDILDVDGLSGVYVGPADLALSLGRAPALDDSSEATVSLLRDIARRASAHGKFAGVHCNSVEYARLMVSCGFRLLTIGSDVRFLRAASAAAYSAWVNGSASEA
jgi:4-hydroxy-2-oxoheptanedioate aldolase